MTHWNNTRILTSLLLLCLSHFVLAANKTIWQGESGDLTIHWTKSDIIATNKQGKIWFSADALAQQDFEADFLAEQSSDTDYKYQRTFTLLSVVGNIASLKDEDSLEGKESDIRFKVIDFTQPDLTIKLTDFFKESDILKAILADKLVKKALTKTQLETISTFSALSEALEWSEIRFKSCSYQLPEDFLSQFAFHHIKKNEVAIRLNLFPGVDTCYSKKIQLGFYLPIPTVLKSALNQAKSSNTGFLMKRSRKIAHGQNTSLSFSTKTYFSKKTREKAVQPSTNFSEFITDNIIAKNLASSASPQKINKVTVKRGDYLSGIARRYDRTVKEIAAWNNLKAPYMLFPGQILQISPPPNKFPSTASYKPIYHSIVRGDTLYGIAKRYKTTLKKLATWNNLQKPYRLFVGKKLRVVEPSKPKWTWTHKNSIHPTLPEFVFKLVGKPIEHGVKVEEIHIHRGSESKPFQTFKVSATPIIIGEKNDVAFYIEDVNFDGYLDMRLMESMSVVPTFLYWLFEQQTEQFVSNSAFAKISSPKFDAEKKQILSDWQEGCCTHMTNYYQVINNNPLLVRQEKEISENDVQQKIVFERVGDEMKIVVPKSELDDKLVDKEDSGEKANVKEPQVDKKEPSNKVAEEAGVKEAQIDEEVSDKKVVTEASVKESQVDKNEPSDKAEELSVKEKQVDKDELNDKLTEKPSKKESGDKLSENSENKEQGDKSGEKSQLTVKQRITIFSAVNVRAEPKLKATLVGKLKVGVVVKELTRSESQDKIGQSQDYWYQIEIPNGKIGWTFGSLSIPFEPEQQIKLYLQIAQTRLQKELKWQDQIDLTDFLKRASDEIQSQPNIAAHLALLHLQSLQKSIDQIEDVTKSNTPPYSTWLSKQKEKYLIHFDDIQGVWHINDNIFWELHEKYYPLPITDNIAWAGAKNPVGFECDGFFKCTLSRIDSKTVKYLKFHPKGQYVEKALNKISEFVVFSQKEKPITKLTKQDSELQRLFAVLRATVKKTGHLKTESVIRQIDTLKQFIEQTPVSQ
ncbi:LysM peptidoglycan-binding domain-containing protein [Candidatus Parabeggiatoa sp. HSG14]|uniref:LysM peptidoglycan-binding domain-containing protein n=1 Tax=Candidatus Parabeggiatoa sp. HSG14 TaxID=3055593 RepID=UPI0025A85AEF|nr:LysM peptidoglycan-binding domain-containing protein [Thiotrichales bacterium HSG14]